jgi:hypothetical protein
MAETVANAVRAARSAIETRLRAQWVTGGGQLLTPIQWPNAAGWETASGWSEQLPGNDPWLKVDIFIGDNQPVTISTVKLNRNVGLLQLTIFIPAAEGAGEMDELAGKAKAIFSRFFGNGLEFVSVSGPVTQQDAGQMSGVVTGTFYFYEQV